jgi:hypothetical protein
VSALSLTLVTAGCSLAKRVTVIDGGVTRVHDPPWPALVEFSTVEVRSPDELLDALTSAAADGPAPCVVRAEPLADMGRRAIYDDAEKGPAGLRVVPRCWAGYDIEKVSAAGIDPLQEPERAVSRMRRCLPPQHHEATVVWQITASAGKRRDELRLRLWFLFERPLRGRQIEAWCKPGIESKWLDPCTLRNEVLPHFIAVEVLGKEPDPCPQRWGLIRGERDLVPVPDAVLVQPVHRIEGDVPVEGGNPDALKERYGQHLDYSRERAVARIKCEIEAVRAASAGARHPTYLRAAATINGLCEFWAIPIDRPRSLLEEAYLSTLDPDEARKRERGSTMGVWSWIDRRVT